MKRVKKLDENILRLLIIFVAIFAIASITKGSAFLNGGNLQTMAKSLTEYGLMAIGCGIAMISGGIDLSTVYIANLCAIIAGKMMVEGGIGIFPSVLCGLLVGALCGAFNGTLVSKLNIPPMLATLGSYQLFMGIAIVISRGSTVSLSVGAALRGTPQGDMLNRFNSFASGTVIGIPVPFLIFIAVAIVMTLLLSITKFGKRVHLVGTNAKASRFAGIDNASVLIRAYMLSGLVSAIAGIISLSRLRSAKADFGSSYTMQTILISVLGGVNPNGGFGNIPGIAIAVLILQMLSSYLNLFPSVSNYYRDMIWGIALIGVLILNFYIEKNRTKKLSLK
ncbi:MAG: ABC transporter permease [Clostridia bacterium]|nr:ABC transporter permease [Clostridia bacterium]